MNNTSDSLLYCYPRLGKYDFYFFRFFNTGLANCLFPLARCIVTAQKYNIPIIEPTWLSLNVRKILRNEKDKRFYANLFQIPESSRWISGIKRLKVLLTYRKLPEIQTDSILNALDYKKAIIVFEGLKDFFSSILDSHELIFSKLIEMARDEQKIGLSYAFERSIFAHVRLGDFTQPKNIDQVINGGCNYRIPLSWYISMIIQTRKSLGIELPVYVFSDGIESELAPLLSLSNVHFITFGSAIADLLALTKGNILISSGSTFSMWVSFLGRMPVIWHKGQLRQTLYCEKNGFEIETVEGDNLPDQFITVMKKSLG